MSTTTSQSTLSEMMDVKAKGPKRTRLGWLLYLIFTPSPWSYALFSFPAAPHRPSRPRPALELDIERPAPRPREPDNAACDHNDSYPPSGQVHNLYILHGSPPTRCGHAPSSFFLVRSRQIHLTSPHWPVLPGLLSPTSRASKI